MKSEQKKDFHKEGFLFNTQTLIYTRSEDIGRKSRKKIYKESWHENRRKNFLQKVSQSTYVSCSTRQKNKQFDRNDLPKNTK